MEYWKLIASQLSKAGWTFLHSSHVDDTGRLLVTVDAHRGDGKRFIVQSEEIETCFLEMQTELTQLSSSGGGRTRAARNR
jgi:hypothetical protein